MRARALSILAAATMLAACSDGITAPVGEVLAPLNLRYEVTPSGDAEQPSATVLHWDEPNDNRVAAYAVYSRASSGASWTRRAETSSPSFHDAAVPGLQYHVRSVSTSGAESASSNVISVNFTRRLGAPTGLVTTALDRAVHMAWSASIRLANLADFSYYRIYATTYSLDSGICSGTNWVLEGTTSSEEFLVSGIANGVPRCFAVSTVTREGHESVWSTPRAETPRYDARNVIVWAIQASADNSGFRFQHTGGTEFGVVQAGNRSDNDFYIDRRLDGSMWLTTVRAGTRVALYGTAPIEDLTSIDLAPDRSQFATGAMEALPRWGYVFETTLGSALHYGGVRVTHVGEQYVILDWSYQSDPGNPMLRLIGPGQQLP